MEFRVLIIEYLSRKILLRVIFQVTEALTMLANRLLKQQVFKEFIVPS
jgi:hypothetical protein